MYFFLSMTSLEASPCLLLLRVTGVCIISLKLCLSPKPPFFNDCILFRVWCIEGIRHWVLVCLVFFHEVLHYVSTLIALDLELPPSYFPMGRLKVFCSVLFLFFSHRGFPADNSECKPCAPPCLTCKEKDSHCLSCQHGYLLLHHSCSATCPQGHYAKQGECHHCPLHCQDCNQDGICASECRM